MERKTKIRNIKELAQKAGASVGSTSMVMSGKWEKKVKREVAMKILKIAREHNYKINPLGRGLQLKQYLRVALMMEGTFQGHPVLRSLSFHDFLGIVVDKLNANGYSIDIIQMQKEKIDWIMRNGFFPDTNDATIFLEWNSDTLKNLFQKAFPRQPFIIIGDNLNMPEWSYLYRDTERMSYQAVNHFIANGHSRIGICRVCGSKDRFQYKLAGYRQALADAGIKFNQDFVIDLNKRFHSLANGVQAANMFMERREIPTAFFCDDNTDAMGMLVEFEKRGIKVPDEVEIIAYGDTAVANMATKPLSYLEIPTFQMAKFAIEYILNIVKNNKPPTPVQKQFKEKLILQGTTR